MNKVLITFQLQRASSDVKEKMEVGGFQHKEHGHPAPGQTEDTTSFMGQLFLCRPDNYRYGSFFYSGNSFVSPLFLAILDEWDESTAKIHRKGASAGSRVIRKGYIKKLRSRGTWVA